LKSKSSFIECNMEEQYFYAFRDNETAIWTGKEGLRRSITRSHGITAGTFACWTCVLPVMPSSCTPGPTNRVPVIRTPLHRDRRSHGPSTWTWASGTMQGEEVCALLYRVSARDPSGRARTMGLASPPQIRCSPEVVAAAVWAWHGRVTRRGGDNGGVQGGPRRGTLHMVALLCKRRDARFACPSFRLLFFFAHTQQTSPEVPEQPNRRALVHHWVRAPNPNKY